ncbi:MAG: hypothetical protein LBT30_08290 [Clostridiales bacterium]|nr:hypothetical protein [Clostridiales bacterium]
MDAATKNTIQALAVEAKKRLKFGYWNEIKEKRKSDETDTDGKRRITESSALTKEEEKYYAGVKKILADGKSEVIVNPIGRLMDKEYYSELNLSEKQQYVFRLSRIYISVKNKIASAESV